MATVRWSLKVSPDTDAAVRTYLGQIGGRKGDFSNFVETAVRARLGQVIQELSATSQVQSSDPNGDFDATVDAIRDRARSLNEAQVHKLVSEAIASTRPVIQARVMRSDAGMNENQNST